MCKIYKSANVHNFLSKIFCSSVSQFAVLDPDVNFSDHLPLSIVLIIPCRTDFTATTPSHNRYDNLMLPQLRWDKANRELYYHYTGQCLEPVVCC